MNELLIASIMIAASGVDFDPEPTGTRYKPNLRNKNQIADKSKKKKRKSTQKSKRKNRRKK